MINHFPQGIAMGDTFLGREKELRALNYNIQKGHHTLLIAPRRFGKTSLALNVLEKLKLPYFEMNLQSIALFSKEKYFDNRSSIQLTMVDN